MRADFYICKHCGNIIYMIKNVGAPVSCCGERMERLSVNQSDAAPEKHMPKVKREGNLMNAEVGSVFHPMEKEHRILWVAVIQNGKIKINDLSESVNPITMFRVNPYADAEVYAYCNEHGLWMTFSKGQIKRD